MMSSRGAAASASTVGQRSRKRAWVHARHTRSGDPSPEPLRTLEDGLGMFTPEDPSQTPAAKAYERRIAALERKVNRGAKPWVIQVSFTL